VRGRLRGRLEFEPSTHRYHIGKLTIPSVTQMLQADGHIDDRWWTDEYAQRGTNVHLLTELYDTGKIVTVADRILEKPYLECYVEAEAELSPRYTAIEKMRVHRTLGFCGCPDRLGRGTRMWPKDPFVLDIKSGQPLGWHALQLALYDILTRRTTTSPSRRRIGLYLRGNGKQARVKIYSDASDYVTVRGIIERQALKVAA
jgi:hypothetical protein